MNEVVFDFEGDGLHPTKIHVVSYSKNGGDIISLYNHDDIRKLFLTDSDDTYFIGHNIARFDVPHLERLLEIEIPKHRLVDTLALSWYLYPNRLKHGLEYWGEDVGVAKPVVDDWHNQTREVYTHRCESDVNINQLIWNKFKRRLMEIYLRKDKVENLLGYLRFKMNTAALQERCKWKVDTDLAKKNLETLTNIRQDKFKELEAAMPRVPVTAKRTKPTRVFKKDGTLSESGSRWDILTKQIGETVSYEGTIDEVVRYEEPNPSSHSQLKDWLRVLGWKPRTFKTNLKGEEIPQLNVLDPDKKGELCPSVIELAEKEPAIHSLAGLFVLNHRISLLEGILDNVDEDGYIRAEIAGLTNTLRFKHSVVVNLPGVNKPYGEYIRPVLVANNEDEILCGSDMASLEDRTKQHYMFNYDPDYVHEMNTPGFDPHLDIGVLGGMMTLDEANTYKALKKEKKPTPKNLDVIRHNAKTTNYSLI